MNENPGDTVWQIDIQVGRKRESRRKMVRDTVYVRERENFPDATCDEKTPKTVYDTVNIKQLLFQLLLPYKLL